MEVNIEPFIHLPQYRVVICQECGYACVGEEIVSHFKRPIHQGLSKQRKKEISDAILAMPDVYQTKDEIETLPIPFPPPETPAIPYLLPPQTDGLRCGACSYIVCTKGRMQAHCMKAHQWKNDRGRGRQAKGASYAPEPWTTGVRCQRLFMSGPGNRYFEVERPSRPADAMTASEEGPASVPVSTPVPALTGPSIDAASWEMGYLKGLYRNMSVLQRADARADLENRLAALCAVEKEEEEELARSGYNEGRLGRRSHRKRARGWLY
ncbi:hypothetical protein F5Y00DRAFT_249450 [Daldinia vernicosa]|uniref:uncharacterized protein n=1 Tax=Daldinia vernicosa TaxID=114800 RepID=UPI002008B277|nr:uncharacterized protein F5Y00DRAFT_249450 [Daldinia vernicosa]KAI0844150.1 hypothetical protein F5Y00DRAFT_249450 [Daldinia vernicosa]